METVPTRSNDTDIIGQDDRDIEEKKQNDRDNRSKTK